MRLNFRSQPDSNDQQHARPPNYSSRSVQIRLLMLVGLLMVVGVAMFEARNPKYYRWLGLTDADTEAPADNEFADEEVDTRLRVTPDGDSQLGSDSVTGKKPEVTDVSSNQEPAQVDAVHRESIETWTTILGQLSSEDRLLLLRVVKLGRAKSPLSDDDKKNWIEVMKQLDQGWEKHDSTASTAVLEMSDEDQSKPVWLTVLQRLRENWIAAKETFQLIIDDRYLLPKDKDVLNHLQKLFDEIALNAVKDNTLANRPQEYDAWFRCLEIVQTSPVDELHKQSEGRVGFLQLYRQSAHYRGKVVTVRGTVRLAYHVAAPKNIHGIDGYYIFIVRPLGGPNSPLTVYSLEIPPGFPEIKDRDIDKKTTELDEEVEFTGVFFKNRAYRAQDGTRVSPTLVAKSPKWDGPANQLNESAWSELPSLVTAIIAGLGIAAVGILISMFVYRQSRGSSPGIAKYNATNRTNTDNLKTLEKEAKPVTIADRLRQITAEEFDADNQSAGTE